MAFVTAWANKVLDAILKNTSMGTLPSAWYVSLHTGDPGDTGTNEWTAGGYTYARQSATFESAATKHTDNDSACTWTNLKAGTISYIGIWDSLTTGVFLWGGQLSASKTTTDGDTFQINAADLDVTLT